MTELWQRGWPILAELVPLDQTVGERKISEAAGQVTLVWVCGVLIVLAALLIVFKKSKRTHLD